MTGPAKALSQGRTRSRRGGRVDAAARRIFPHGRSGANRQRPSFTQFAVDQEGPTWNYPSKGERTKGVQCWGPSAGRKGFADYSCRIFFSGQAIAVAKPGVQISGRHGKDFKSRRCAG